MARDIKLLERVREQDSKSPVDAGLLCFFFTFWGECRKINTNKSSKMVMAAVPH
jgi:hypothetical protein